MEKQHQSPKPPQLNESTVTEYIRNGEETIISSPSPVPLSPKQSSHASPIIVQQQEQQRFQSQIQFVDLSPCTICGRKFAPATLVKHVGICQKMQTKKRRIFDSSKQRREGTDLADFLPKNFGLPQNKAQHKEQQQQQQQQPQQQQQNQDVNRSSPPKNINPIKKEAVKCQQQLNDTNFNKSNNSSGGSSNHNMGSNSNYNLTNNNNNNTNPPMASNSANNSTNVSARSVKRNLGPVQEQCPHCERHFGIKAYDRHVEWCKEKSRFVNNQNSTASLNAAKERLQARTKYKAPCLKTKRALNREKYSGLTCGDSTNSLSDHNLSNNNMSKSYSAADETRQRSMSNSMTSSFTSDGGFSDNYDPFLSAKKQFEELFSPTTTNNNCKNKNIINNTSTPKINKLNNSYNNNNKNNLKNTKTNSTSNSITNLYNNSNNINNNFKRTSSLRLPNKKLPTTPIIPLTPIFLTNNMKPKIQRGISDEGPISPNFIKSKEYDEIPIKSVYGNELIQQQQNLQHYQQQQHHHTPKLRDSHTIQNRKNNLKLDIKNANGGTDFSLSKTDSLAVFLKYENDFNLAQQQQQQQQLDQQEQQKQQQQQQQQQQIIEQQKTLTEKDIKDKSNIISKRSSSIINKLPIKLEPISLNAITKLTMKQYGNNNNDDINYIDPKLINLCDNLPINIQKLNDSDTTQTTTTDSSLSGESIKKLLLSEDEMDNNFNQLFQQQQQRNSGERKNILKRQLKLNRDNFLYASPVTTTTITATASTTDTTQPTNVATNETTTDSIRPEMKNFTISQQTSTTMQTKLHEHDHNLDEKFLNLKKNRNDVRLLLDDFDFEEFLTSFEDDEKHPIFKDYKEFLQLQKQQQQQVDAKNADDDDSDIVVKNQEKNLLPINLQLNSLTISNNNNNNNSLFNINRNEEKYEKHVLLQRQQNPQHHHNKHEQQIDDIYLSSPESLKIKNRNDILLVPTSSSISNATHLIHKSINDNNNYCEPLKIDILSNNNSDENDVDDDDDEDADEDADDIVGEINEVDDDDEDVVLNDEDGYNDNNDVQMVSEQVRPLSNNSDHTANKHRNTINNDAQENDCEDDDDNNYTELEKDLLKSCNELNGILINNSSTTLYPRDSDDLSSLDCNYQHNFSNNKSLNYNNAISNNNTNNNNNNNINNNSNSNNYHNLSTKISSDSAYGSLSRQTPPEQQQHQQQLQQKPQQIQYLCRKNPSRIRQQTYLMPEINTGIPRVQMKIEPSRKSRQDSNTLSLSSSGSESSLPPLVTTGQKMEIHQLIGGNKKEKIQLSALSPNDNGNGGGGTLTLGRMSKFCHECGYRFMLAQAKFCMECGVKRVVL